MTAPAPFALPAALAPLAAEKRWVVWRWIIGKDGKKTKPPFCADAPSKHASTTDPSTWCDFNTAMLAYSGGKCDGLGFVLSGSGLGALDLDHCRNAATGTLHPWASDLINHSGSYCEVTPSDEGVRIIGLATGKPLHRKFSVPNANGVAASSTARPLATSLSPGNRSAPRRSSSTSTRCLM
jgi:primase-polymerase (primpol)-like protein